MPEPLPTPPPRCALIGEALADLFAHGAVLGGAPFNVARNLAALGQAPLLVTRLGDDALAAQVLEQLAHFGLPSTGVQRDLQRPTGVVKVVMTGHAHRFEIAENQAWDAIDAAEAVAALVPWQPSVVCFGSLAQRSATSRDAIRGALAATPALRLLDLNLRDGPDNRTLAHDSLQLAHIAKMNDEELARVLQWFVHPGDAAAAWGSEAHAAAVAGLIGQFDLQQLIVTRGAAGYAAYGAAGEELTSGSAPAVHIEDTVGAGDAFTAITLLGRLLGWPLAQTLQRASEFAASVCTLRGAVTQDLRFYDAWRSRWQLHSSREESGR